MADLYVADSARQTRRLGELHHAVKAGLIAACIAQAALEYDEHGYDGAGSPLLDREIEENLWRAIRHGMDGRLIDFRRGEELEAHKRVAISKLRGWPFGTGLAVKDWLARRG